MRKTCPAAHLPSHPRPVFARYASNTCKRTLEHSQSSTMFPSTESGTAQSVASTQGEGISPLASNHASQVLGDYLASAFAVRASTE